MFFRRKGWLRKEYDEKLLQQLESLKQNWLQQKDLLEICLDPSDDVIMEAKMAEIKYFSLFKEAKNRNVSKKN